MHYIAFLKMVEELMNYKYNFGILFPLFFILSPFKNKIFYYYIKYVINR